ncbi:MAG: hypothetical protein RLZZ630_1899, partial [Bacteroidota bacterium]
VVVGDTVSTAVHQPTFEADSSAGKIIALPATLLSILVIDFGGLPSLVVIELPKAIELAILSVPFGF